MHTRSQKYAAQIVRQVEAIQQQTDEKAQKQYGSMAHKLPVLIRTAGLAQALGFVEARGTDMHQRLLKDLAVTLNRPHLASDSRIVELGEYMRLTQQALEALLWYKRFAQSVLEVSGSDDAGEEA